VFRQHVFSFATKTAKRRSKEAKDTIEPAGLDRRPIGRKWRSANTNRIKGSSEKLIPKAISGGGYAGLKLAGWAKNKRLNGTKDAKRPYRPSTAGLSLCLGLSGRRFGLGKARFPKSVLAG
jgi:hypothetical protein